MFVGATVPGRERKKALRFRTVDFNRGRDDRSHGKKPHFQIPFVYFVRFVGNNIGMRNGNKRNI